MEPPPIHKCHHVSPEVPLVALLWRLQLDLSILLLVFFPPLCFALQSHPLYCSGPVLVNKMDCSFGKSSV